MAVEADDESDVSGRRRYDDKAVIAGGKVILFIEMRCPDDMVLANNGFNFPRFIDNHHGRINLSFPGQDQGKDTDDAFFPAGLTKSLDMPVR